MINTNIKITKYKTSVTNHKINFDLFPEYLLLLDFLGFTNFFFFVNQSPAFFTLVFWIFFVGKIFFVTRGFSHFHFCCSR